MQNISLLLFGAVLCVVYVTVSAHGDGGGHGGGGGKWGNMMEKFKVCDGEEMNTKEAMKSKEICKEEMKKKAESASENMERRRRSPNGNGEAGGKYSKGKKGGKGRGGRRGKKMLDMAVCSWKKDGVLDSSGKFSEEGCRNYVNKIYPESKHEEAFNKMKGCADLHGNEFAEAKDNSVYGPFGKCCWQKHMELCKIEMPKWGKKGNNNQQENEQKDEEME